PTGRHGRGSSAAFGCAYPTYLVLNVVLDGVFLDEAVDRLHAGVERSVDADERLPLLGQRVLGKDRLDRALGLAGAAGDALLGVDDEDPLALVDAVDRADVDARPVLDVDARLRDHVRHAGHTLARWLQLPAR